MVPKQPLTPLPLLRLRYLWMPPKIDSVLRNFNICYNDCYCDLDFEMRKYWSFKILSHEFESRLKKYNWHCNFFH